MTSPGDTSSPSIIDGFFERSPDVACVLDGEGRILRVNARWMSVLGYSGTELAGTSFAELAHPEDRASVVEALSGLDRELVVRRECRFRTTSRGFRWLVWAFARDPASALVSCTGREITERHREVEELRARAELLDVTHDPIFARDPTGTITFWNRGAEAAYGFTREEALGKSSFQLLATKLPRPIEEIEAELALHGRWEGEVVERSRDGRSIVVACRWALQRDELGHPQAVLETHNDVTARREVERMKTEFVSTVSHELRTPLTSIRGSLRLLEQGVLGPLSEDVAEMVHLAHANAERLIRLVNDLLDLEKIEAGKLELRPVDLDAAALVDQAVGPLRGLADGARIVIGSNVPGGFVLRGDEDRLIQVLTNLVSNAIKFSPPGSKIDVMVDRGHRPGRVRFSVRDRGPGIPPDRLGKLFGKFQQLDASDSRQKGGTGLGLAISKAIVEQHRGEIGVDSTVGEGSTFWFELGLSGEPAAQLISVGTDEARYLVLLFVDRETTDLADVRALLAREGCDVVRARGREEAERILEERSPHALVIDLGEPSPERLALLADLRAHAGARWVPVIVLGQAASGAPAFGASFVDWLPKPLDARRLSRALRRATRGQGAPKVLIVDDDRSSRKILQALLRPLAIECIEAEDGLEGIRLARLHRPDLIVLDVEMPRADGFDVVDVLRLERTRGTPLVVYSDRELDNAERDALTLGATRWLTKARVSEDELVDTVRELLHDVAEPFDAGPTDAFLVPPNVRTT